MKRIRGDPGAYSGDWLRFRNCLRANSNLIAVNLVQRLIGEGSVEPRHEAAHLVNIDGRPVSECEVSFKRRYGVA
jgi:hypothetical protein